MRKIKAVIDTNIFVSGIISSKGSSRRILELAKEEVFKTVTAASINKEILSVLHREHIYIKYNLNEEIIDDIAAFLYEGTILVEGTHEVSKISKDPADDKFISCGVEGEADYIVSGDEHLLNLKHYRGIQIISAKNFLKILNEK